MRGFNLIKMLIPFYFAVSLVVIGDDDNEVKREAVFFNGKDAMTTCLHKFIACSSSELQHASEHKNLETLCRLFPNVISCMEKALSKYCQSSRQHQRVRLLYDELNRMETKYSASTCKTFKLSGNVDNSGISLVPSYLQMFFIVILATLLILS